MRTRELPLAEMALRAYCAGIIDGEGYIGCKKSPPRGTSISPRFTVRLHVSMADREPVEAVASLIGGRVWIRDRKQKSHHSIMYHFEATSFQAVQLLNKVMPFLRCKRHQAQMACQLHDLKQSPKRFKTVAGGKNGTRVLSDSHLAKCENIYLKMIRRPYQRRAA